MTPKEWNILYCGANVSQFRKAVENAARIHLATVIESISTEQLVEALYPRETADLSLTGDTTRKHIYTALSKLAVNGLEDCCMKGGVNGQFMGKPKRPWLWFSSGNVELCPHCNQIMPEPMGVSDD